MDSIRVHTSSVCNSQTLDCSAWPSGRRSVSAGMFRISTSGWAASILVDNKHRANVLMLMFVNIHAADGASISTSLPSGNQVHHGATKVLSEGTAAVNDVSRKKCGPHTQTVRYFTTSRERLGHGHSAWALHCWYAVKTLGPFSQKQANSPGFSRPLVRFLLCGQCAVATSHGHPAKLQCPEYQWSRKVGAISGHWRGTRTQRKINKGKRKGDGARK